MTWRIRSQAQLRFHAWTIDKNDLKRTICWRLFWQNVFIFISTSLKTILWPGVSKLWFLSHKTVLRRSDANKNWSCERKERSFKATQIRVCEIVEAWIGKQWSNCELEGNDVPYYIINIYIYRSVIKIIHCTTETKMNKIPFQLLKRKILVLLSMKWIKENRQKRKIVLFQRDDLTVPNVSWKRSNKCSSFTAVSFLQCTRTQNNKTIVLNWLNWLSFWHERLLNSHD